MGDRNLRPLSEQLRIDHECGDFGNALDGYAERAAALEQQAERLRAENEALRKDAQRWRTIEPLFYGVNLHMNGTAHFLLPGEAIKPRARTAAEAVDAMASNAK